MNTFAYRCALLAVFTLPLENLVVLSSIGRLSKAAGVFLAIVWLANAVVTGTVRAPKPFHLAVFSFVIWNLLSVTWSISGDRTFDQALTYAQVFLFVYILWDLLSTKARVRASLQAYVLGASVSSVGLIANVAINGAEQYQRRFTVGDFEINDLGLILVIAIPIAWYLLMDRRPGGAERLIWWVALASIPAATVAIVLTGSRSGLIALVPCAAYIAITGLRTMSASRAVAVGAVVGSFMLLWPLVPDATVRRITGTPSSIGATQVGGRLDVWAEAFTTFADRPILGVGSGAFRTEGSDKPPHNFALRFLVELGLVGFALFGWIVVIVVRRAFREPERLMVGLWVSLIAAWAISASVHNFEDKKHAWFVFAVIVASSASGNRSSDAEGTTPARLPAQLRVPS